MDKIIFEIKNQIYTTGVLIQDFFKEINLSTVLLTLAMLYVFFLRKWSVKRIFSFLSVIFLLFILLVRVEALLTTSFEAETSRISIGVGRTVFLIIAAAVFIYNAIIKE